MLATSVDNSRGLHPAHLHMLQRENLRQLYQQYEGKWQCDCCKNNYDAFKNSEQNAYHCNQCYYDLCLQCWYGNYHPFHNHRLKPTKTEILYPSTGGCWFCDACHQSFHELSGPSCYSCEPCGGIDLCDRCFNGDWIHPLHPGQGHRLKPVNPQIVYRGYSSWCCSICEEEKDNSDKTSFILFHCTNPSCDFDMCFRCFQGEKHHLHQHPLVKVSSNWNQEHKQCQNCAGQLLGIGSVYRCFDTSCSYILCSNCFQHKPQPHPLHREHTLECSIPLNVYPRTKGSWMCSNCQSSKMESDTLFHCQLCSYSICHSCYQRYNITQSSRHLDTLFIRPKGYHLPNNLPLLFPTVPVMAKSVYPSMFPAISKSANSMRSANGYSLQQTPVECIECRIRPAQVTFVHNGMPHQMPICCKQCAQLVQHRGRQCPLCNQPFERALDRGN